MKSFILYSMNISEQIKMLQMPLVIIGLGKSGQSALALLLKSGHQKNQVLTFDEKALSDLKSWSEIENLPVGTLLISPGVPLSSDKIQNLKKLGWAITSEINLAAAFLTDEIVIGITGSVGKSTVTSILGEGAKSTDSNAFIGGNLGTPFCEYAISLLENKPKAKYVILELSSYQLENCEKLKLNYSAITYLSANHLERYSSKNEYYLTKCSIGKITKDTCFVNSASTDLIAYKNEISSKVVLSEISNEKIKLVGKHNLENYCLAEAIAHKCGWSAASLAAMRNFSGLSHRLETVGQFKEILFINDSKATAMDSVLVATEACYELIAPNKKLFLLLGGKDKNLPWEQLKKLSTLKSLEVLYFGQCASIAKLKSELKGTIFQKMSEAVTDVFKNAKSGDVVLLSPGGTSLDEFKNFEERGNIFKDLIKNFYSEK